MKFLSCIVIGKPFEAVWCSAEGAMDDLDDLLDEIEHKFCGTNTESGRTARCNDDIDQHSTSSSKHAKQSSLKPKEFSKKSSEVDDLLNDIDSSTNVSNMLAASVSNTVHLSRTPTPNTTKPCDQLRCTACDFRIVLFDDYQWDKSVDYLFLRNNIPDFNKLKAKLRKSEGSRAYACQCCWRTITSVSDLQKDRELKWVCAGRH